MACIKLTKGFETIVDAEFYDILAVRKWRAANWRNAHYAVMTYCEPRSNKKAKNYSPTAKYSDIALHCLVHWLGNQDRRIFEPGWTIDHINKDTLDNRIENLRLATRREQILNRGLRIDNSSGLDGIYWEEAKSKWHVAFKVDGKLRHFGRYNCKLQALLEYNLAKRSSLDLWD
jgi:HNH endonuclease